MQRGRWGSSVASLRRDHHVRQVWIDPRRRGRSGLRLRRDDDGRSGRAPTPYSAPTSSAAANDGGSGDNATSNANTASNGASANGAGSSGTGALGPVGPDGFIDPNGSGPAGPAGTGSTGPSGSNGSNRSGGSLISIDGDANTGSDAGSAPAAPSTHNGSDHFLDLRGNTDRVDDAAPVTVPPSASHVVGRSQPIGRLLHVDGVANLGR